MRSRHAALALALALSPVPAAAQTIAPIRVEDSAVEGSPVRRARAVVEYRLPFERVAAKLLDYQGYPTFMRRFRRAQIVRRNRAETDVYFEIALPDSLGNFWFLHRMHVTRSADRLLIDGVSQGGNAGHVETRIELTRAGRDACTLSFSLYALPTVPVLPTSVNQLLRQAVVGGAHQLRQAVEGAP